jgi:hypothetical protein
MQGLGCRAGSSGRRIDVFVRLGSEAGGADREKYQVLGARAANALAAAGRDEYHVVWGHVLGRQLADFDPACTRKDYVSLSCSVHSVPAGCDSRENTSSRDGGAGVFGNVGEFSDEAAFIRMELGSKIRQSHLFVHIASRV